MLSRLPATVKNEESTGAEAVLSRADVAVGGQGVGADQKQFNVSGVEFC